ncbi:MAK10-like protein [Tanacetum coccineum]
MTNKINTMLKAITDRLAGSLPSDMVKNPKLSISPVLSARCYPTEDPQCSTLIHGSINAVTIHPKHQSDFHDDEPAESEEKEKDSPKNSNTNPFASPDPSVSFITKKVRKLNSFFESFSLAPQLSGIEFVCTKGDDGDVMFKLRTRQKWIIIRLRRSICQDGRPQTIHSTLLADETKSYHVGVVKDVEVHIGKLKLLNDFYVIDMKKDLVTPLLVGRGFLVTANAVIDHRMSKIVVGERIIRLVFGVKGVDLGAIPIKLKSNMWESEDLINNLINWNKPPKNGDGAWHAKIRLIDPDGKEFTKTLQSILTTRKLSERAWARIRDRNG